MTESILIAIGWFIAGWSARSINWYPVTSFLHDLWMRWKYPVRRVHLPTRSNNNPAPTESQ